MNKNIEYILQFSLYIHQFDKNTKDLKDVFDESLEKFFDPKNREEYHRHGIYKISQKSSEVSRFEQI